MEATEQLFYLDELSPEARARALSEYRESYGGAEVLYDTLCEAIAEAVEDFEDKTGVRVHIGGPVYMTTCDTDPTDLPAFPDYGARDWTTPACDIYDAWARGGCGACEDIPGKVNRLIQIRDRFERIAWGAKARGDWWGANHSFARSAHYEAKIVSTMFQCAKNVCSIIDYEYEAAWEEACEEQTFEDECLAYGVLFLADGCAATGPWAA